MAPLHASSALAVAAHVATAAASKHCKSRLAGGNVITGLVRSVTVMILVTGVNGLPHGSVAVQVSVIVPPQAVGLSANVDRSDVPVIRHPPVNPLL